LCRPLRLNSLAYVLSICSSLGLKEEMPRFGGGR
jgi:hypothetical protein